MNDIRLRSWWTLNPKRVRNNLIPAGVLLCVVAYWVGNVGL